MAKQYKETAEYMALLEQYNKLAKKADRRMRELERFSRYEEFKNIKKYAYAKAEKMIKEWSPDLPEGKAPRWQRNTPFDTRSLKAKIKDIESFLSMKSSTVTGVKEIYKKRAETLNRQTPNEKGKGGYGTKFTWQQLAKFFEDGGIADKTFDKYGSATVLLAFGEIQHNKDKALDAIENFNEKDIKISDNEVVEDTIEALLSDYGEEVKELIS